MATRLRMDFKDAADKTWSRSISRLLSKTKCTGTTVKTLMEAYITNKDIFEGGGPVSIVKAVLIDTTETEVTLA